MTAQPEFKIYPPNCIKNSPVNQTLTGEFFTNTFFSIYPFYFRCIFCKASGNYPELYVRLCSMV